jgi:hypothetical protein
MNLSPSEKAKELVEKFRLNVLDYEGCGINEHKAKQCALIAVDEIINSSPRYPSNVDWDDCGATHQYYYEEQREQALKFWQEVKEELLKNY